MADSDHVTLWRYVDLYRLLDMLQQRTLPFIRLDKMSDPYEALGSRNTINVLKRRIAGGYEVDISTASLALFESPQQFLVNCWHANKYESDAMWKLYANQGIAIKTTETRLLTSIGVMGTQREEHYDLPCTTDKGVVIKQLCFDKVRYEDFERGSSAQRYGKYNCIPPYITKRKSFEHEREYRIVIDWNTPGPEQYQVLLDLNKLIQAIIIHPLMHQWQVDVIKNALEPAGLAGRAKQSELYKKP